MWGGGSNYPGGNSPFAQGAYQASGGYGGNPAYPSNSGPPPPPGAGYGGYGSAYNVNQYPGYGGQAGYGQAGYGGGYAQQYGQQGYGQPGYGQYQQQPQQPQHGYPGYPGYPGGGSYHQDAAGQGGYSQGAAVAGFTAPQAPQQAPPSSYQYAAMQNQMAHQSLFHMQQDMMKKMGLLEEDEDEEEYKRQQKRRMKKSRRNLDHEEEEEERDEDEEKRKMEERLKKMEERAAELQAKLESDDGLKDELRVRFVDELVRRQAVNGTFEPTEGTVYPFDVYDEEDPVAVWFKEAKDDSIVGEKWEPEYDVQYLRNGIEGWGTDEAAIIAVVSTRCNSQRNRLLLDYKTAYGRDLVEDLHGDLSGKFRECVLAMFETPARYDAYSVKKAIYGLGTNERALIEIMMTRTNAQIQEMVEEYNNITYHRRGRGNASIEEDLRDDLSGHFKQLTIAAAQGNRRQISPEDLAESVEESVVNGKWTGMFHVNYSKLLNMDRCKKRAQELYEAGQERWGTDDETFIRIFSTQDYYTMRAIWDEYVKISQWDPINVIKSETSGDFERGLLAIAQNIRCRPMYFAERLYGSMKGLGTDDSTLIRVVVSRSEIDLVQIKACFLEKYHQTLWKFIMDDTSGDYRKLLCGIVGKN